MAVNFISKDSVAYSGKWVQSVADLYSTAQVEVEDLGKNTFILSVPGHKVQIVLNCSSEMAKGRITAAVDELVGSIPVKGQCEISQSEIYSGVEAPDTSGDIVALIMAERLFQPVRGTSAGSVYYAVAIGEDLKIAVRVKGTDEYHISIRCEGDSALIHKVCELSNLHGNSGGHASIHFDVNSKRLVSRTVAGVISDLSVFTRLDKVALNVEALCS